MLLALFIGLLGGVIGLIFTRPKTWQEGLLHLFVSVVCAYFFHQATGRTAMHFLPWLVEDDVRDASIVLCAILGWWSIAGLIKFVRFKQNQLTGSDTYGRRATDLKRREGDQ